MVEEVPTLGLRLGLPIKFDDSIRRTIVVHFNERSRILTTHIFTHIV